MAKTQLRKRTSREVLLQRFTPRIFNLLMQGYVTAKDIRARSKDVREACSEETVELALKLIRNEWQPLNRENREKLRLELIEQAQYMKRKAYKAIDSADKPSEVKELLNTVLKINSQIAELAEISGGNGKGKDAGDVYNITHTENKTQTINIESWSEDDLEKAKQILKLQKSMNAVPVTIEGNSSN